MVRTDVGEGMQNRERSDRVPHLIARSKQKRAARPLSVIHVRPGRSAPGSAGVKHFCARPPWFLGNFTHSDFESLQDYAALNQNLRGSSLLALLSPTFLIGL